MKKPVAMTLVLLLCTFVFAFSAGAVDAPHYDPLVGNVCGTCHTVQQTLGSTGYNNICQNCHRPGNPAAGSKSITPADAANPFGIHSTTGITRMYQTSHRWDGSDTNPAAGAQPPVQAQMTTNNLRTRTGGQLSCVRCHNQHSNANGSFLRMANDQDQMCRDCHRSRDVQSHTQGSHPVGINYAAKVAASPAALFNPKTVNANPANPTSNLFTRMSSAGGTLLCSTCHSVHFADSRSSTVDGSGNFANLSSGDGYLLRTDRRGSTAGAGFDSSTNICTSCHADKRSHNLKGQDIQCADCHGAHVGAGNNIYLIRRDVTKNGQPSQIFFRYSGARKEYKNAQGTGVCEGCHTVPTGTNYPAEHSSPTATAKDCAVCHFHNSKSGSFSGACTTCHGYPPTTATVGDSTGLASPVTGATATSPGAHQTHAVNRWMGCNTCHNGYTYDNKSIDIGFAISSSNFKGFVGPSIVGGTFNGSNTLVNGYTWKRGAGTVGTDTAATISCSVYCHGATLASGTGNKPVWTGTNQAACGSCHATTGISTGSHTNHLVGNPDCGKCHTGATPTSYPYTGTSHSHINGQVDVANGFTSATKSCSSASCHANPYGPGSLTSPVWGTSVGCAACHNGTGAFSSYSAPATGSHTKHRAKSAACNQCHAGTIAGSYGGTNHADGKIDVTNGYPTNVAKHAAGSYTGTCSTAACHADPYSSGTVTTPVWGTNAGCAACHNGTGAFSSYSSPATGSHAKHIAGTGVQCNKCHAGALKGVDGGSAHVNGVVNVDVTLGYYSSSISKHAANTYAVNAKCSTAACHADPYGPTMLVSPVWGTTSGCGSCHNGGGAFTGTGNGPATGSHNKHMAATALSVKCGDCHSGAVANSTGGSAHANGVVNVTQSYYSSSVSKHTAGTYSANAKCSTTCHSPTTVAVITPVWNTASTCASCHDLAPATGSHVLHSGISVAALCGDCHAGAVAGSNAGTAHLNGTINVTNGYPFNVAKHAPGSGYSSCSAASCHVNPYGTGTVTTPLWGAEVGNHCAACHNGSGAFDATLGSPSTGSHAKHMALSGAVCNQCHAGAIKNTSGGDLHKNGNIDVTNGYPSVVPKHAAGAYTGTCSTAVCHGSGNVPWGGILWSATDQCGKCHSSTAAGAVTGATPFYGTSFPTKVTSNTDAKVGAHTSHITSTDSVSAALNCADCHGTVTLSSATHMNGTTSFAWSTLATTGGLTPSYNASTGICSNVYCHGAKMSGGDTSGTNTTPTWRVPFLPATLSAAACGSCHGFPPSALSGHPAVTIPVGFPATVSIGTTCSCHANINPAGNSYATIFVNKALHINGILEVSGGGSCDSCHGYPPAGTAFVGTQGNWSSARSENYLGGGGAHTINNHVSKLAKPGEGFANCSKCHNSADHQMSPILFNPSQNIKVNVNQRYRLDSTKQAKYTSNRLDAGSHLTGTCSNISCHFGATPKWDPSH